MQLSLASLQAPKLGRAPGIADEPFAWDSRDFLRKKCIGKQVLLSMLSLAVLCTGAVGAGQGVAQAGSAAVHRGGRVGANP